MLNHHKVTENLPTQAADNATFTVVVSPVMSSASSVSILEADDVDGGDPCAYVRTQLSDYADDELNPSQARFVESHLSDCPKCAEMLNAIFQTDDLLLREWRDDSPLPSSLQRNRAIDNIIDALPPVPETQPIFSSKRRHARARWMRFSTGIAGCAAFFAMLYSSYRLGYEHALKRPYTASSPSALLSSETP